MKIMVLRATALGMTMVALAAAPSFLDSEGRSSRRSISRASSSGLAGLMRKPFFPSWISSAALACVEQSTGVPSDIASRAIIPHTSSWVGNTSASAPSRCPPNEP